MSLHSLPVAQIQKGLAVCVSDFVDPTFAPATGTPEVGRFNAWESQYLLRGLRDVNFVAFDLVEVSPPYDTAGQTTCLLAANLVYEFIALLALARKANS